MTARDLQVTTLLGLLDRHPVVFGPAHDGGYYLVGLSRPCVALFQDIAWGSETVLRDSLARARQLGLAQSGFRLVFNNGPDAGEAVPHLHCHIIGGRRMGWPPG